LFLSPLLFLAFACGAAKKEQRHTRRHKKARWLPPQQENKKLFAAKAGKEP
jgi:hypothetical protein